MVKSDGVRNGTKANACHGWLLVSQASRQWVKSIQPKNIRFICNEQLILNKIRFVMMLSNFTSRTYSKQSSLSRRKLRSVNRHLSRMDKKTLSHAHKTGSWYLLGVLFEISDLRSALQPFFIRESIPPGCGGGGGGSYRMKWLWCDGSNLRQIPLKVRAISAKIIY